MEINFNSNIIEPKISDSILNLLPTVNNTIKNQMFFDSSINELFKKGSGVKINGYIGRKLNWYDQMTDFYINEISPDRNFYQLEPTMTVNIDNEYISAVYFTDYVSNLKSKGALTDNQNRLFSEEYYKLSFPIDYDKFFNYSEYYCLNTNNPDYILIDSSDDKNPWKQNIWIKNPPDTSGYQKALRPIICFNDIKLYNYGEFRRDDIDCIDTDISDLNSIEQKPYITINGNTYSKENLPNTKLNVLFTSLSNQNENNIVYEIYFDFAGLSVYEIKTDGSNISGIPADGEILLDKNTGNEYFYKNNIWNLAQKKTKLNQAPLFMLYDENGIELDDATTYPLSSFTGSKVFSYSEDTTESSPRDVILDMYLNYNSDGNVLFENNLEKDVFYYNKINKINSTFFFGYIENTSPITFNLNTCWTDMGLSQQKIINKFVYDGTNRVLTLSSNSFTNLEVIKRTTSEDNSDIRVTSKLTEYTDYVVNGNQLLLKTLSENDEVIASYSTTQFTDNDYFYEYPLSLTCNPTFNKITDISYMDLTFFYKNNTFPNKPSSNILLEMLLSSDDKIDVISSIQYCSDQYRMFIFKFINKITEYATSGRFSSSDDIDSIVDYTLNDLSKGLTPNSKFYNSGVGVSNEYPQNYFIPPTPSFLGLYNVYEPTIDIDYTSQSKSTYIYCHDGSMILSYGDFRDDVILNLQNRIFLSIKDEFKKSPVINIDNIVSNAFHQFEYSYSEYCSVMEQFFSTWCYNNNVDYKINSTYDKNNPFTFNWSSMTTWATNQNLLGGWRGIYEYFYGTDRPHTHPWECLGFSIKPDYWDAVYGPAPYTSGNKKLWGDINDGVIDENGTVDQNRTRYNLIYYIPVDENGNLLDPVNANLLGEYPSYEAGSDTWKFGDGSPVETVWKRSTDYPFAVLCALYLMKPSAFINLGWDTDKTKNKNSLTYDRNNSYSEMFVHTEIINDNAIYKYGLQQFIAYNLIGNSYSVSEYLGNKIRGLGVNLAYRIGGFTNENAISVSSDTYGLIPDENVHVIQYQSPINDVIQYSAMLIVKEDIGWKIYGYDQSSYGFNTFQPNTNSIGFDIEVSNVSEFRTTFWSKSTSYVKEQVVSYNGKTYICNKNHTSGQIFELSYWNIATDKMDNSNSVEWFTKYTSTNISVIPFGTTFTSYQDISNVMCGIELYQTYNNISFDEDNNSHWYDCMKQFMLWDMSANKNDFILLSPLSNNVTMNYGFGNVLNTEELREGKWSIIDADNKNMTDFNVIRTASKISITNNKNNICGCKFYKNTIEHMLILDNNTIFDDIIFSPEKNIQQHRFYIQGYKTSDWYGRLSAAGFVISGNIIIPNFDTCADNFRHIYDIEAVEYDDFQKRGRANIGFYESNTLSNLLIQPTNQFEIYQSVIQNKGTASSFNRLLRSSVISSYEDIEFYEDWAFRIGTYGAVSNFQSLEMFIRQQDIKNDSQIIEFITSDVDYTFTEEFNFNADASQKISQNVFSGTLDSVYFSLENFDGNTITVSVDGNIIIGPIKNNIVGGFVIDLKNKISVTNESIIEVKTSSNIAISLNINLDIQKDDITSNNIIIHDYIDSVSGNIIEKDVDWVLRQFDNNQINFKKKNYKLNNKHFLKTAGYVNLDTINWTATNEQSFNTLYQSVFNYYGSTTTNPSFTFTLNSDVSFPYLQKIISSTEDGYFKINSVTVNITSAFQLPIVLNVGTKDQLPDGKINNYSDNTIVRIPYDEFQNVGTYQIYPSAIVYMDGTDKDVFMQICCSNAIPENINLGEYSISFEIEYVSSNNIKPNDRAWVYDINNSWNTYKLIDTGINIYDITPNIAGVPVVSFDSNTTPDMISSLKNDGTHIVLSGTNLNNISPTFNNVTSTLITGDNTSTPIYYMNVNAGMQITSFEINIMEPFSTSDGSDLTFEIGDVQNTSYIADSYVLNNPAPTVPSLSSVNPITVQAFNNQITVLNGTPVIDVYVTRSGNLFGKVDANGNVIDPTSCGNTVTTSFDWNLYSLDENNNIGTVSLDSGSFSFLNPDTASQVSSDPDYWMATIEVTVPENGNYAFVISNVTGGTLSQSTTIIEMTGTTTTYNLFDPTKIGIQNIDPSQFNNNSNNGNVYVSLGDNTTGSAIINVQYEYTNGFEIGNGNITQNNNQFIIQSTSEDTTTFVKNNRSGTIASKSGSVIPANTTQNDSSYLYGGNIFAWIPTRFKNIDTFNSNNITSGDYIEIDNINGGWAICQFDGTKLNPVIEQSALIDTKLIQSAYLYNIDTKIIEQYLDIYDPMKGFIQGDLKTQLDFISNNNPAIYNRSEFSNIKKDNDNVWTDSHVGQYWFNTKASPYLVYEMNGIDGTNEYKIKNWGKLCPGTSVEIYQWIKSPVLPSQFESYVNSTIRYDGFDQNPSGTIDDIISNSWVEKTIWNKITNEEDIVYYFWVKNPTTSINKSYTAYEISQSLMNIDNGIPVFSILDSNMVMITGSKNFITDNNTTLKINWKLKDNDSNFHKEWQLLNEGNSDIPDNLWNKMCSSIIGFNICDKQKTFTTTLSQDFKAKDTVAYMNIGNQSINLPINYDVKIGNQWMTYGNVIGSKISGITDSHQDILKNSLVEFVWNEQEAIPVPNENLTEYEQIGNLVHPEQSWFGRDGDLSSRFARKIIIKYLNEYFSDNAVVDNWYENFSVFTSEDEKPSDTAYIGIVDNISDLQFYSIRNEISYNECVLVNGNDSNGFWSLWTYQPFITQDNGGFVLYDFQKWRLQDSELWEYADWYADGYSKSNYPTYIFSNLNERNSANIDVTLLYGTLVQVNNVNQSDNRWTWYVYDGSSWTEVARQSATIQLSDAFFQNTYVHGIDDFDNTQIQFRDGTYELDVILKNLRNKFFTSKEQNSLFFEMVKAAISNSYENDWVFKTSLLDIGGFMEQFNQRAVIVDDKLPYVEEFINEYKPYHVKIKDFVYSYTNGIETSNVKVTDFDYPQYYDSSKKEYRNLIPYLGDSKYSLNYSGFTDEDTNIVKRNIPWADWYNQYQNGTNYIDDNFPYTEDWNPVRKTEISLIFDRKQCSSTYGWDTGLWDGSASYINPFSMFLLSMFSVWGLGFDYSTKPEYIYEKLMQINSSEYNKFKSHIPYMQDMEYIGPSGFGDTMTVSITMIPMFLTTTDYKKFRPDIRGGYTDDREVNYFRDLYSNDLVNNMIDGTVCFVKERQSHFILVKNLLYKVLSEPDVVDGKEYYPRNWFIIIGNKPISGTYDPTIDGFFKDISYAKDGVINQISNSNSNMTFGDYQLPLGNGYEFIWLPFACQGWDAPFYEFDGAAARISQFYEPSYGMIQKDDTSLMNGCGYKGNVISGGDFSTDEFDTEIIPKLLDLSGISYPSDVTFSGGGIGNPFTSQYDTPEELSNICMRDSLVIEVAEEMLDNKNVIYQYNNNYHVAYKIMIDMIGNMKVYDLINTSKKYSKYFSSFRITNLFYDVFNMKNSGVYYDEGIVLNGSTPIGEYANAYWFSPDYDSIFPNGITSVGEILKYYGFDTDQLYILVDNVVPGFVSINPANNVEAVKAPMPFLDESNFDEIYDTGALNDIAITLEIITKEDVESGISEVKKNIIKERLLSTHYVWNGAELMSFSSYEDVTEAAYPDVNLFKQKIPNSDISYLTDAQLDIISKNYGVQIYTSVYRIDGVVRNIGGTHNYNDISPYFSQDFAHNIGGREYFGDNYSTTYQLQLEYAATGVKFDDEGNGCVSVFSIPSSDGAGYEGIGGFIVDGEQIDYNMFSVENVDYYQFFDASMLTTVTDTRITFVDLDLSNVDPQLSVPKANKAAMLGSVLLYYINDN